MRSVPNGHQDSPKVACMGRSNHQPRGADMQAASDRSESEYHSDYARHHTSGSDGFSGFAARADAESGCPGATQHCFRSCLFSGASNHLFARHHPYRNLSPISRRKRFWQASPRGISLLARHTALAWLSNRSLRGFTCFGSDWGNGARV